MSSSNLILSDYDRKVQVDYLKEIFPALDLDVLENLLGAVDYDLESALTYLERFTEESNYANEGSTQVGAPAGRNTAIKPDNSRLSSTLPPNASKYRENQSGAQLSASLKSTDFRQQRQKETRYEEEANWNSAVNEVYTSRSAAAANLSNSRSSDEDSDDDDDSYGDKYDEDAHSQYRDFEDNDDDLESDGGLPRSQRDYCVNEKFKPKTVRKSKGFADSRPAAAVKAASKKTAAPTTSRATEKAPLAPDIDRSKRNAKAAPDVIRKVSFDGPRSNSKKAPLEAQPNSTFLASHDGIRGHLAVSQKVGSRVNPPRNTSSSNSPAQQATASSKQSSSRTNAPTSARAPPTRQTADVTSASRHHKSSAPTANSTPKPRSGQPNVTSSRAQPNDDARTLRLTSTDADMITPRNFLKPNAVSSARAPAESKSRSQEKLQRDVSKVINDYERQQNSTPKSATRAANANANDQRSHTKQQRDELPADAEERNGAEIDLGDLVLRALGQPARASLTARAENAPLGTRESNTPDSRTRPMQHKRIIHEYELAGTDSPIKYKRGKLLGKGAFGHVYLAFTDKGQLIAVKEIEICQSLRPSRDPFQPDERGGSANLTADAARKRFDRDFHTVARETQILSTIHHQNVVNFLGVYRTYDMREGHMNCKIYVFTEYISGDTIANLLRQFGAFSEPITRHYIAQILSGMTFLHLHNIIHRDIKGQNIMVDKHGLVKLIDFGCAKKLTQQNTDITDELHLSRQSSLNIALDQRFSTRGASNSKDVSDWTDKQQSLIGTPYWMAPEVIRQDGHSYKSDCWSLGCTVFEMASGNPPWSKLDPIVAMFHIGNGGEIPRLREYAPEYSLEAEEFVSHCLERNVNARYTAQQLLDTPFSTVD